jgi:hypothetical protein
LEKLNGALRRIGDGRILDKNRRPSVKIATG